jgi:multiple sugar transport system ATP-binding protein
MAAVLTRDIVKTFGEVTAVNGISLTVPDGEFMVLLGPSGCGKTTFLRIICGLEQQTSGDLLIGGNIVNDVPPRARGVAMMFQSYGLYPHYTVRKNIAFPLRTQRVPNGEVEKKVEWASQLLGIGHLLDRRPRQLSGGERQRVALARALVREPTALLLDEPLSNLDAKLRVAMRTEIKELHQRLKTTTVYVTHDQIEAMTMADKIVVMHDGIVEQIGSPLELYDRPDNQFVASFIGSPAMNFLKGKVKANGSASFEGPNGVKLPLATAPVNSDGRPAVYGVRPEHFTIADDGAEAEIVVVEPTGSETQVFAKLGGEQVVAVFRERHQFKPGDKVRLKPEPSLVHLFDESTGKRL